MKSVNIKIYFGKTSPWFSFCEILKKKLLPDLFLKCLTVKNVKNILNL